jgi:putative copper export protein
VNDFDLDTIRLAIHLLSVCIWVGGQIILGGLVPVLREISPEAPKKAAARFGQVAWPAFGVAVITGIWNIVELEGPQTNEYNVTLGVKLLAVTLSGMAAFIHQRTPSPIMRAITGALGLVAALVALVLGVML